MADYLTSSGQWALGRISPDF